MAIQIPNLLQNTKLSKKKTKLFRKLKLNVFPAVGRSKGKIVTHHKGGANRTFLIRHNQKKIANSYMEFLVLKLVYDANRTSKLALICNSFGICQFIIAPENIKIGSIIHYSNSIFSKEMSILPGSNCTLNIIPTGSLIHNIEKIPGQGGVYARSAGCFGKLMIRKRFFQKYYAGIILPSKKLVYLSTQCTASVGSVSNTLHKFKNVKKAGKNRNFGKRPTVRGVAMNPIDHPHGGGEGKSATSALPKTPWGYPAKWKKTIKVKKIQKIKTFISKINKFGVSLKNKY